MTSINIVDSLPGVSKKSGISFMISNNSETVSISKAHHRRCLSGTNESLITDMQSVSKSWLIMTLTTIGGTWIWWCIPYSFTANTVYGFPWETDSSLMGFMMFISILLFIVDHVWKSNSPVEPFFTCSVKTAAHNTKGTSVLFSYFCVVRVTSIVCAQQ